jgi:predicted permease
METGVILQQMAVILILVLIGVFLQRKGIVNEDMRKRLSWIVVNITNPLTLVSVVLGGEISMKHSEFLTGLFVCSGMYVVLCVLGELFPRILKTRNEEESRCYRVATVYGNTGFMGIPIATALFGGNEMIYVIICNILFLFFFYSHGISVLQKEKSGFQIKNLLNPGIIMATAGLFIYWFGVQLPPLVVSVVTYTGNPTIFLSMVLLGASLSSSPIGKSFFDKRIWGFILIRMVALPVGLALLLRLRGAGEEMVRAYCLMMALPVGNLPLIQAEKEGRDSSYISRVILITTLVSFITVTLLMSVLF